MAQTEQLMNQLWELDSLEDIRDVLGRTRNKLYAPDWADHRPEDRRYFSRDSSDRYRSSNSR